MNTGRRDTILLKGRLDQVLGKNASKYWSTLKSFLIGRLNREEFERLVQECLPSDQSK
jgi:hypothetical protein